ncbi:MAG: tetratricopeptide repeat protein [Phycisphaerales bacterium]|nr:MAG: tetratricopeptide repeat protein [Phycisphaerales bacterium]
MDLERLVLPYLRRHDSVGLAAVLSRHFTIEELVGFLSQPRSDTVKIAVACLSVVGRMSEYDRLAALLHHADPFVVSLAEYALCEISFQAGSRQDALLLRRAARMIRLEECDQALLLLNRVLVDDPQLGEAYFQRALVHHTKGNYEASLEDCQRALELNPNHYGAHAHMGHVCTYLEDFTRALECYYAALKIHPRLEGLHECVRCLRRVLARRDSGRARA